MLKQGMRLILAVIGGAIGYNLIVILGLAGDLELSINNIDNILSSAQFFGTAGGVLVGFFIFSALVEKLLKLVLSFDYEFRNITLKKVLAGLTGLILGLIFALIINFAFSIGRIPRLGMPLQILFSIIFAYLGFSLAFYNVDDILSLFPGSGSNEVNTYSKNGDREKPKNKILDTSVIIDGRIADICKTGFVEGDLIIPEFILEELRHIADSSDELKRNRGRRGLDILKQMQKDSNIDVEIVNKDFEEIPEVDSKLVKLARVMDGRIVTNDYNLNKVAELQGVKVMNINELANAVKPVVLPGEEMEVELIKEGKEKGQGVGYLDDGTMIVVDDGINYIGETIEVLVTSILQTAAGRMIFARPKRHADAVDKEN